MTVRLPRKAWKNLLVVFKLLPDDFCAFRLQLMAFGNMRKFPDGKLFRPNRMVVEQLSHIHVQLMMPSNKAQPIQSAMDRFQIHFRLCLLCIL